MSKITLRFSETKETKNSIRFEEEITEDLAVASLGAVYINKATLKGLGWNRGNSLYIQVSTTPNL